MGVATIEGRQKIDIFTVAKGAADRKEKSQKRYVDTTRELRLVTKEYVWRRSLLENKGMGGFERVKTSSWLKRLKRVADNEQSGP